MGIANTLLVPRRMRFVLFVAVVLTSFMFYYITYHTDDVKNPLPDILKKVWPLEPITKGPKCPVLSEERLRLQNIAAQLPSEPHPIDDLIESANDEFSALLAEEVFDLNSAAAAYRKRRGRHPPPRFNEWLQWAQSHNVVLIEGLFDRIYNDLEPFWALPAKELREAGACQEFVLSIRKGKLTKPDKRWWMDTWHDMLEQLEGRLPDVDLPFNTLDESRLLVPHETISEYITVANSRGRTEDHKKLEVDIDFTSLPEYSRPDLRHDWIRDREYWLLVRDTCPSNSAARDTAPVDLSATLTFPPGWPTGTHQGYVSNWTLAKDPCTHPHLRNLHGSFIEPLSLATSVKLLPILSGSKLPNNNDILIPAPKYWTEDPHFSGGVSTCADWDGKREQVFWRGVASGGRNKESNWMHFQRHRFISMLNVSHVRDALHQLPEYAEYDIFNSPVEVLGPRPAVFPLPLSESGSPSEEMYDIAALSDLNFTAWLASWSPPSTPSKPLSALSGFIDLQCFPRFTEPELYNYCPYTDPYFAVMPQLPMSEMFKYKYLPDVDGNSFSGRYRGFLNSHSVPIKATVYDEWHDDRLIAWKHFVPMDNTFVDFYGIMDYFVGYDGGLGEDGESRKGRRGHDEEGRQIAMQGAEWAQKVLRREDMLAYTYRLVLEYARIVDERRESMGFVGDLFSAEQAEEEVAEDAAVSGYQDGIDQGIGEAAEAEHEANMDTHEVQDTQEHKVVEAEDPFGHVESPYPIVEVEPGLANDAMS